MTNQQQSPGPAPITGRLEVQPKRQQPPRALGLFSGGAQQTVSSADWQKLNVLAGSPPPRVASVEQRRPTPSPLIAQQEGLYAEVEKEAMEDEMGVLMDPATLQAAPANMDPMQQIMWVQLQQNQALLARLIGNRTQDPVLRALGGGGQDSGGGSSSSGVRGCLARDVFICRWCPVWFELRPSKSWGSPKAEWMPTSFGSTWSAGFP